MSDEPRLTQLLGATSKEGVSEAVAHIQAKQEATRRFHAELFGDDDGGQ